MNDLKTLIKANEEAYKKWYVEVLGQKRSSANTQLVALRKARLKETGTPVLAIEEYDLLSETIEKAGLLNFLHTRDSNYHKLEEAFDIDANTEGDDLKSGIKYYLQFLESKSGKRVQTDMGATVFDIEALQEPYSKKLIDSHNIIFRGAPGTGKTYLAKQIAADIVSNGAALDYDDLQPAQKEQIGFVQFHPSYDYTDFVEGLRPRIESGYGAGSLEFTLEPGVFKKFVEKARENIEASQKTLEEIHRETSTRQLIDDFFSDIELGMTEFKTKTGGKFLISALDEKVISIYILGDVRKKDIELSFEVLEDLLNSGEEFKRVNDMRNYIKYDIVDSSQFYASYYFPIHQSIVKMRSEHPQPKAEKVFEKKYVFIIDEINRGEISKIFGELFFSIDPGYRGEKGAVSTQYSNLHRGKKQSFYIPENVYIIGTMNDIDRSVDSFDFAMRRRFRFIEIKAIDQAAMLDRLGELKDEALRRMEALNQKIEEVEDLNANYHVGPAYFLKLEDSSMNFDDLWTDHLKPLLQDYVRGRHDEEDLLKGFEKAYNLEASE